MGETMTRSEQIEAAARAYVEYVDRGNVAARASQVERYAALRDALALPPDQAATPTERDEPVNPPGKPDGSSAHVVAEIIADLRARAVEYSKPWFAGEAHALREAADRIAAEHPDAEAWAMGLAEEVLAAKPLPGFTPAQLREKSGDVRRSEWLAAIVRRCMGGA